MPWWLAFVIATPMIALTIYLLKYCLKKRELKKKAQQRQREYKGIAQESTPKDEFRNL